MDIPISQASRRQKERRWEKKNDAYKGEARTAWAWEERDCLVGILRKYSKEGSWISYEGLTSEFQEARSGGEVERSQSAITSFISRDPELNALRLGMRVFQKRSN